MSRRTRRPYPQRLRMDSGQHRRTHAIMLLMTLALLGAVCRLYGLMVRDYEYYAGLALRNQSRSTGVQARRGMLLDRNMNILAMDVGVENVYLAPLELRQRKVNFEAMSEELGSILNRDASWILEQAKDTRHRYNQIGSRVDEETAQQIRDYIQQSGIAGIHLEPASRRWYPYGTLAAQVIGFTNLEGKGSEGVEAAYNTFLEGRSGRVVTTKANNEMDMPYSLESFYSGQPGNDVILTLDMTVQQCLEKQMAAAVDRYDVQNGAFGLVMNCKTGEILAMATLGSYDPNDYLTVWDPETAQQLQAMEEDYLAQPEGSDAYSQKRDAYTSALSAARLKQWRNRVLSDGYEPGSTFKVLTMAAALDSGAIDLNTSFYCRGAEQIPGRSQLLHCWRSTGHGSEQTPQALQNSCNIAFAHIALKLGGERFYEYIQRFGILEKTGVDLAGESKGIFFDKALVTDTDKWGTASLTSGSFGQTFKITPLQLVRAIASVVNGGYLLEPYIVSEVVDSQGNTVLKQEPTIVRRTISEETSATMRQLIESVVTEGTAKNAAVSGFSVGGKTGTSEKIDVFDENGQRVQDKIVSFVGIAPMENPEYIVLVALDSPSRQTGIYISGGVMAAPTVGAVLEDILPYLGVQAHPVPEVMLPDFTGMNAAEVRKELKKLGLEGRILGEEERVVSQLPLPGTGVDAGSQVLIYFGQPEDSGPVTVPDFSGMHLQQANAAAGALALRIQCEGNVSTSVTTVVTAQNIPAGTLVPVGTNIVLRFTDTTARD